MTQLFDDIVAVPSAPGGVHGRIRVPPSKSLTQRAILAAALAGPGSEVHNPLEAEDPRLLVAALQAVGFRLEWGSGRINASGREAAARARLFLGNNATGARFTLGLLTALPGEWLLDGTARLRERPMAPLVDALRQLGAEIAPAETASEREELHLPLRVRGRSLTGREVRLDASASSQFVSALLLLGATLPGGLVVRLTSAPPSRPYLALTVEVLEAFGARVVAQDAGRVLTVSGGGLRPAVFAVEGDWSAAAFPLAAVAVAGGRVEVLEVRHDSRQGDAVALGLLAAAGCVVRESGEGVVLEGPVHQPVIADLRDTPDLFPALAVVVAVAGGRLDGLEGLAVKESDRLSVMTRCLVALGFAVERGAGWFAAAGARPRKPAQPTTIEPAGDHRIAMALAVAGCVLPGVRVAGSGCVVKSWPEFWQAWHGLVGGPE
ncbi:MAG: 3-phosphoshikimate 1-carboxyvinyltransferase [Thermoanaerobaculales bacterium]